MSEHVCSLRDNCTTRKLKPVLWKCHSFMLSQYLGMKCLWLPFGAMCLLLSCCSRQHFGFVNGQLIGSPGKQCELYSCGFYFAFKRLKTFRLIRSVDGFFLICWPWNPVCPLHHVKRAKVTTKINIFLPSLSDKIEDELEMTTVCHRPEGLEQLEAQTNFTKRELQVLYRGFKNVRTVLQWTV